MAVPTVAAIRAAAAAKAMNQAGWLGQNACMRALAEAPWHWPPPHGTCDTCGRPWPLAPHYEAAPPHVVHGGKLFRQCRRFCVPGACEFLKRQIAARHTPGKTKGTMTANAKMQKMPATLT